MYTDATSRHDYYQRIAYKLYAIDYHGRRITQPNTTNNDTQAYYVNLLN